MRTSHRAKAVHYLYITDESGIGQVFPTVKENLVEKPSTHVSLVYASGTALHVFAPELHILARHFSAQFIPFLVHDQQTPFANQATLEAILNANTRDQLVVRVFGQEEFVDTMLGQLLFLGLTKDTIQSHFLR